MAENFDRLEKRVRLTGELVTVTGLHVGASGDSFGATDLPVLRDARGMPYIPGSSLKGVVRSTLESLVRALGHEKKNGELWACDPLAKEGACGERLRRHRVDFKEDPTKQELPELKNCTVCNIFGSHQEASHVRITDLIMTEVMEPAPIEVRDGVAIDRDLKKVHGGQKYDFEVVPPGTRFKLEVFFENPDDATLGLVMAAFDQVKEGFTAVGGFSSRGLGRVTFQWQELLAFTAAQILVGQKAEQVNGPQLEPYFAQWSRAAAQLVRGEKNV